MTEPIPLPPSQESEAHNLNTIRDRAIVAAQDKVIRALILAKDTAESFTHSWYGIKPKV
jgi:hypothetical protein